MLSMTYYAKSYAGIIGWSLVVVVCVISREGTAIPVIIMFVHVC